MKPVIALVDDHVLLRNGLAVLLQDLNFTVSFQAGNGRQMIDELEKHPQTQLVLMDINMPVMDGFDATLWLKNNRPHISVLALSMLDDEASVIKMIRNGAKGYVLKDCEPDELQAAIQSILQKGFYHSELVSSKLIQALAKGEEYHAGTSLHFALNEREKEFLTWVCTDLSYKEIADKMKVSPRTVDGYRDALHEKLEVKSRVGMALFAIRQGIVSLS